MLTIKNYTSYEVQIQFYHPGQKTRLTDGKTTFQNNKKAFISIVCVCACVCVCMCVCVHCTGVCIVQVCACMCVCMCVCLCM